MCNIATFSGQKDLIKVNFMDIRSLIVGALLGVTSLVVAALLVFAGKAGALALVVEPTLFQSLALVLVSILLLVLVGGSLLTRRLSSPLLELANALARISRGRVEESVPFTTRNDAIGEIARAVVRLAERQRRELSAAVENAQSAKRELMLANSRLDEMEGELDSSRGQLDSIRNELDALETVDKSTGLPNRQVFDSSLERELKRIQRNSTALSIALYQITGWEALVQRYGREAANAAVAQIGKLIADTVRTTDMVARYGEDALVLMLPETGGRAASRVVEDIHKLIAVQDYAAPIRQHEVRVAVGLAASDTQGGGAVDFPSRLEEAIGKSIAVGGESLGIA